MDLISDLIKEHTEILNNFDNSEIINQDDPDLLRMEEIMIEIKKLQNKTD